jgi:hypothetical protein
MALSIDRAGMESDRDRYRLDGNAREQLEKKTLPALAAFGCSGVVTPWASSCTVCRKQRFLRHHFRVPPLPSWRALLLRRSAATAAVESSINPKRAIPAALDGRR